MKIADYVLVTLLCVATVLGAAYVSTHPGFLGQPNGRYEQTHDGFSSDGRFQRTETMTDRYDPIQRLEQRVQKLEQARAAPKPTIAPERTRTMNYGRVSRQVSYRRYLYARDCDE